MTWYRSRRHFCVAAGAAVLFGGTHAAVAQKTVPYAVHPTPRPLPDIEFKDREGKDLRLSNFKGKVVLLNVWATWCPPCRREMPTLDRLQGVLGGKDFEVLALSIDRAGVQAVEAFFMEVGVKHLRLYIDQSMAATRKLAVVGLPTTLLIDRAGREVWRYAGAAEWDSDEWMGEIRKAIETMSQ
jgi:thiol-disulfide isomerase/thioredoxin